MDQISGLFVLAGLPNWYRIRSVRLKLLFDIDLLKAANHQLIPISIHH